MKVLDLAGKDKKQLLKIREMIQTSDLSVKDKEMYINQIDSHSLDRSKLILASIKEGEADISDLVD